MAIKTYEGRNWVLYGGADCVEAMAQMEDNSIDFAVYSSPFSSLYVYSDSSRDLGNATSHEDFFKGFSFFAKELYRVMKPGTVVCDYVKDLIMYQGSSETGESGLYPFSDMAIQAYRDAGFQLRARTTIWTDPQRERDKTNAERLLYGNLEKNSRVAGVGNPEYIVVMRKESVGLKSGDPVNHAVNKWGDDKWQADAETIAKSQAELLLKRGMIDGVSPELLHGLARSAKFPLDKWTQWASPVWLTNHTHDVLNSRFKGHERDEKHLTPTPLTYIERVMKLYSAPGDIVYDPFAGIGSTGVIATKNMRKYIGTELKPEYAERGARFIREAEKEQGNMFSVMDEAE